MIGVVVAALLVAFAVYLLVGVPRLDVDRVGPGIAYSGHHPPGGDVPHRRPQRGRLARWVRGSAAEGPSAGETPGASGAPGLTRAAGHRTVASGRHADDSEVGSALALLALGYRSGLPTWDVLDAVADGLDGPPATDLRQVAAALRWGASENEAWACIGPAWAPAARAVAVAHQAGVPPGPMLLAASDDLRAAELERLEVSAAKVGVRLVAPLGLVLLPAFCLTTVAPLVIALAGDLLEGRA